MDMVLTSGSRLGPYEIISRVGAGGMGEVFRARDTRLDRTVAIKILPRELATNAQLRLRFDREAKSISQLAHPHICTLHDVGQAGGIDYLVMEFLEGETLADRIGRGPLPLPEVLRFGAHIAEALDRAHRAGIVHRDLKPGNIMITKSGAKLLDFGLARSISLAEPLTDATQHKPLTEEGTILGTYQYMAPEQLAGEEADARSDIFALGAMLYEMLTGTRAFQGKTKTSLAGAIMAGQPRPPSELQPMTPSALDHVISKCLAKERDDRWQSAADIAFEIEWISKSMEGAPAGAARRHGPWMAASIALSALLITAAVAGAIYARRRLAVAEQPVRSDLLADEKLASALYGPVALSPDGSKLAFLVERSGKRAIAVRDFVTGEMKTLAGTDGASSPFWSSDSRQIGFFADLKLKTISAGTSSVQVVCDANQGRGGSWNEDGTIVFAPDILSPLYKVSADGGAPVAVTHAVEGVSHRNPLFLPDGRTFLFTERTVSSRVSSLYAGSIDGAPQKRVMDNASNAVFQDGWLFFVRDHNLVAQRFDVRSLKLSGSPVAVASHLEYFNPRDVGNFSVAPGKLVHVTQDSSPREIIECDRNGRTTEVKVPPGTYRILDISPDGHTLAVSTAADYLANGDIWLLQIDRAALSRLTFANEGFLSAVFSPDGRSLATSSGQIGGGCHINIRSLTDSSSQSIQEIRSRFITLTDWSRDGRYLLASFQNNDTGFDVEAIDLQSRTRIPIVHGPADELAPAISPGGKWIAYGSNESGMQQVYVTKFPSGEGKWQVSREGGTAPRWSRDGKQLFFLNNDRVNEADFGDGAVPEIGAPAPLLVVAPADPAPLGAWAGYGITPADLVVTTKAAGDVHPAMVHLVTNWRGLLPR
jgi:Tol biopolymer transport system component